MSNPHQSADNGNASDSHPFIRETVISSKNRTPFWKKLLFTVLLALVFGLIAAGTFFFTHQFLEDKMETTVPGGSISFPEDVDPRSTEPSVPSTSAVLPSADGSTEVSGTDIPDPSEETAEEESTAVPVEEIIRNMLLAYTPGIGDLKSVYQDAAALLQTLNHSLVTVTASNTGTDWFDSQYAYDTQTFGVIIAIGDKDILILTPEDLTSDLADGSALIVTFGNRSSATAYTKATDTVSGLAVLAVSVNSLSETTAAYISEISLGNSYSCGNAQPVIALGAPIGYVGSVSFGILSYVENDVPVPDNTLRLLHTNIPADANSRGFLVNYDGELIGWLDNSLRSGRFLDAVGISALKGYISNLSNGISSGYLGIIGQNITSAMLVSGDFPCEGFYITGCVENSPALEAGLQSGDIITEIAGTPVGSLQNLRDCLLKLTTEQTVSVSVLRKAGQSYQPMSFDVRIIRR